MSPTPETAIHELHEFWTERLGDSDVAMNVIDLIEPGFSLVAAGQPDAATGHCRFGGAALLEPGTPWPYCEDVPLSLLAVLDIDALPESWVDDLVPPGTGLLNFFVLDTDSEQRAPSAFELLSKYGHTSPEVGRVIRARSANAVETEAPEKAGVFKPVAWTATPGFCLPHWEDSDWNDIGLDDVLPGLAVHEQHFGAWAQQRGALGRGDRAFGLPDIVGNPPLYPPGASPHSYRSLLQVSGNEEWSVGGDGGDMLWSIPADALDEGDFSQAVPTPALS